MGNGLYTNNVYAEWTMRLRVTNTRFLTLSFLSRTIRDLLHQFHLGENTRILDVGCGDMPYKGFFAKDCIYVGIDTRHLSQATVLASAESMPFRNETFDVEICTQVLEHIEEPTDAVTEMARTLVHGGTLVLSTHGIWLEGHEKRDWYRWTRSGLVRIISSNGLVVKKVVSMNPVSTLSQIFLFYVAEKNYASVVAAVVNAATSLMVKMFDGRGPRVHGVHVVVARRPSSMVVPR